MDQEMPAKFPHLPGVSSASITTAVPMGGSSSSDLLYAEDRTYREGEIPPIRRFVDVTPGAFSTLGTPLIAGRDISWTDIYEHLPVAIISENFAKEVLELAAKRSRQAHPRRFHRRLAPNCRRRRQHLQRWRYAETAYGGLLAH